MPRRAGRQQNITNPDVQTVFDYYRVTLYNVFLNHLVQEMETRILGNAYRYCAHHLLPSKLADLRDNMLPTRYTAFAPDPPQTYETFKSEIARWRVGWSMPAIKVSRLQGTLQQTCNNLYLCIFTITGVLLTMSPTSAYTYFFAIITDIS